MERAIRFPLVMDKNKEVRTLEELKKNFNLDKVIEYYLEGKLKMWLQDRSYTDELSQIEELEWCEDRNKIALMLCVIFGIEEGTDINTTKVRSQENRGLIPKSLSDYNKWGERLEFISFTQEELDKRLLSEDLYNGINNREIYLYGDEFVVTDRFKNTTYIGVNTPVVKTISSEIFKSEANNIKFENVRVISGNDALQKSLEEFAHYITDDDRLRRVLERVVGYLTLISIPPTTRTLTRIAKIRRTIINEED